MYSTASSRDQRRLPRDEATSMELEPNFSTLSFDINQCEIERRLQRDIPAHTNYPAVFDPPWDIDMVDQFPMTGSYANGFLGVNPNLIDLSSLFEDDLIKAPAAARSDGSSAQVYDGSINGFCHFGHENFGRLAESEFPPFRSQLCIYSNEDPPINTSRLNTDYSLSPWPDPGLNDPELSTPIEDFSLSKLVYPGITLPESSHRHHELSRCSQIDGTLLEYDDALEASLFQHIPDEHDPISSLCCSNQDGNCTGISSGSPLGNHHIENHDMNGQNLYVRPDLLALTSTFENCQSQSQYRRNQAIITDEDLLTTVDINNHQADIRSSRPVPTLDDLIVNLDFNPKPPSSKRKRSSFTPAGKEKVRLVRDWGACLFCRSRKVSCSATEVCDQCVRTVDDPLIAKQICLRTRIQDIYIGVKELHGRSLDARRARLQPFLRSLVGQPQDVTLSLNSETTSKPCTAKLRLQVMRCSVSPEGRWKSLKKVRGIYVTSSVLGAERSVIVPSSLPGIEKFDNFGRDILLMSAGSLSGRMTRLLDDFLFRYSSRAKPSRLRHLSNFTSRIASLNNFVAYGFLNLQDGSYDLLGTLTGAPNLAEKFVSETVHDQLRLLAAEGLEPAEKYVFSELDNLSKIICASNHARIIAGICLLRLLLVYRDRLIRDQIRRELPHTKKYHQFRLEKSAFMYRRLTVAYGTLCREHDSPLTMDWEDEETDGQMTWSADLELLFSQLRWAFRHFCNENLTGQYDDVFKSLISEPIKGRKTRKRRRVAK